MIASSRISDFVGRLCVTQIQYGSQIVGSSNNFAVFSAAKTGNTCISETVKSTAIISTTILRYKTTYRWEIVSASTCKYNTDRQPEISIWPPKPEIIKLWQIASKFQRQIRYFRWCPARQMIPTTIDYQKLHDWLAKRLYCHFRLSVFLAVAPVSSRWAWSKTPDLPF